MKKHLVFLALAGVLGSATAADIVGNAKAAENKVSMCIGCHGIPGYQASFPEIHKVPMISGQGAKYIVGALTAYKKGERKHPTMKAIAASLSACATVDRLNAGGDVHDLLVAIRDNDRATFDAHVDRRALKAGIEARSSS